AIERSARLARSTGIGQAVPFMSRTVSLMRASWDAGCGRASCVSVLPPLDVLLVGEEELVVFPPIDRDAVVAVRPAGHDDARLHALAVRYAEMGCRIDRAAGDQHAEIQVRAGGDAGAADHAQFLPARDAGFPAGQCGRDHAEMAVHAD